MPANQRQTLRQQQAIARREQIMETALQLFAKQGFDSTSTRQIAREAGITEGLIFHYFPSKSALLNALLETQHCFISQLRTLITELRKLPAAEVLPIIAREWLKILWQEKAFTLLFISQAQINPEVAEAYQNLTRESVQYMSAYLTTRVKAGELRATLPIESSARMFFASLITFFLLHHNLSRRQWEEQSQRYVRDILSVWFDGSRI